MPRSPRRMPCLRFFDVTPRSPIFFSVYYPLAPVVVQVKGQVEENRKQYWAWAEHTSSFVVGTAGRGNEGCMD